MMKKFTFILTAVFALAVAANAQGIAVGEKIENFSLPDTSGVAKTFNEMKGKNGAVIMFVSSQCPVVKAYNERMNEIAADYAAKGIAFIGINANATEMDAKTGLPADWVGKHIAETYKFNVLMDKGNVFADKLGATKTPEAYFVGADGTLLYHGAIDNDQKALNITQPYLRTAFDEVLAGKPVAKKSANAFGCTIKRAGQ
ncbi:MAG TPA: redoxin domain-containing protein [Pyrinomonadaceae bacterium]|nr:redoxin domain-containing protein [Pyrinomonadaceae bacterium]